MTDCKRIIPYQGNKEDEGWPGSREDNDQSISPKTDDVLILVESERE